MANPAIKATGTATGWTYDSINIAFPATTAVGDGLLFFVSAIKSGSGSTTTPTVSGWTNIFARDEGPSLGSQGYWIGAYHKIATSGDISTGYVTFNLISNVEDMNGICYAISDSPSSGRILSSTNIVFEAISGTCSTLSPGANSLLFGFGASYRGVTTGSKLTDVSLATDDVTFTELFNWYVPNFKNTTLWSATRASANATGDITFSFRLSTTKASIAFVALPVAISPTVTTQAVSSIASTTATGNGTVTAEGDFTVTERGVCWSTTSGPTTASSKATSAGTTGAYTVSMTGLTAFTTYYVKAYAINSVGTSYGSEVTFKTLQVTNSVFLINFLQ